MSKGDTETTLQELKDLVKKFNDERDWSKHHSPKNVAISLCIEAAELLENFQYEYGKEDKQAIADELADVFHNCLNLANRMDIDISQAFINKFERLSKKYPTTTFNSKTDKFEDYMRIKKDYRRKGK